MNFEDEIGKKFEGKTSFTPSKSVWGRLENSLNVDLIHRHQSSKRSYYKWSAIAVLFITFTSFATHYFFPFPFWKKESSEKSSYNALLFKNNIDSGFLGSTYLSTLSKRRPVFFPMLTKNGQGMAHKKIVGSYDQGHAIAEHFKIEYMQSIKPTLEAKVEKGEIYTYYNRALYASNPPLESKSEKKLWVSIGAGAGNFNSLKGTDAIFNSSISPLYSSREIRSVHTLTPLTIKEGLATTVGLNFGLKVGPKWTLESGVAYTKVDSKGSASINLNTDIASNPEIIDFMAPPNNTLPGSDSSLVQVEQHYNYNYNVDLSNSIQFTSIPLKAGYFIVNKTLSLKVSAGLVANYLISNQLNNSSHQDVVILHSQDDLYNKWSFDGIGGVEIGYPILDRFAFTVAPNYRHSITLLSESLSSPSRFVLQAGLKYSLK